MNASKAQTFALFCALRVDARACNLSKETAHSLLSRANGTAADKAAARAELLATPGAEDKARPGTKAAAAPARPAPLSFESIFQSARSAGLAAGNAHVPVPMIVRQHANPLDDRSPVVKQYEPVLGGVCGFAWVEIAGNTSFGKWMKAKGHAAPAYPSGLHVWIYDHGQSMEQKVAHAGALAQVLTRHGIKAHVGSRMD